VKGTLQFDYTTVGHVTIDVLADGTRQPGGAAFYSALQAARLGCRARIVTRGVRGEIDALLEPYAAELSVEVEPAAATTTLHTSGWGGTRSQRISAWAGPIEREPPPRTAILHLAPVARELSAHRLARGPFVGLTPQGLARAWRGIGDTIRPVAVDDGWSGLAARADAVVISELERSDCAGLVRAAGASGAVVVITDGPRPATLLTGAGADTPLVVPALALAVEDLGAGDVFAAALFIELADGVAPERAARFAMAAAAVRMAGSGAAAIGDRAAIAARMASAAEPP